LGLISAERSSAGSTMTATRRLTAILAADVAGYSRSMGADEEGTRAGAGGPPLPAIIPNESRRALKWRSCSRALEDSGRPLPGVEYSGRLLPDSLEPAGYSDKSGDLNRASSAGSTTSSSFHDSALASVRHPALLRHASPPKEAESERSAPVAKGCFLLAERKRGRVTEMTRGGADTGEYLKRDRGFESGSLQRRESPTNRARRAPPTEGGFPMGDRRRRKPGRDWRRQGTLWARAGQDVLYLGVTGN
jgi:hypothetical protein